MLRGEEGDDFLTGGIGSDLLDGGEMSRQTFVGLTDILTTRNPPDINDQRHKHYNATVTLRRQIHVELLILRMRPDAGVPVYEAGQYTTLGLGYWEPRTDGCDDEHLANALESKLPSTPIRFRRRSSTHTTGRCA